ncbi:1449_t:CDS:1, partial [Dentiscutata heterogama]
IIGATPERGFKKKLYWIARCLACPFTGIFYMLVIENKEKSMFAYWLPSERFITDNDEQISYMPFGYYAKKILKPTNNAMKECIKDCVAEASILERLSSLVSAYYIIVGIGSGVARIYTPSSCTDWPYVSVLLAWTFVVIYKRSICGKLMVKSPNDMLNEFVNTKKLVLDEQIIVKDLSERDLIRKRTLVIFIGITTIIFPWLSVLMAYNTPPIGYFCRSRYLTVICSVWSINSTIAFISHLKGESRIDNNESFIHRIYVICGFIMAGLLLFLALLCDNRSWWVEFFGEICKSSDCIDVTC